MQNQNEFYDRKDSVDIFEKFSIYPIFWLTSLCMIVIFLLSFYFIYFSPRLYIFKFMPYFVSYVFTYLLIYSILFIYLAFSYRTKSLNMKLFSNIKILGLYPLQIISRTGLKFIDIFGFFISASFGIISLFIIKIQFLFPLFLFITAQFLFAIIFGRTNKWNLTP